MLALKSAEGHKGCDYTKVGVYFQHRRSYHT